MTLRDPQGHGEVDRTMTVDNISQGEPREIGARAVFKVLTEEINSGEPREIAARGFHKALTEKISHRANPRPSRASGP